MTVALEKSFSRAAARYERHARVQTALADWVAAWAPKDRVGRALEVGAGTGVFTRRLQPWPDKYVATDLSPAMCAAGAAAVPTVEWKRMPAEMPLPGPWDWIVSSGMLQWAVDPEAIFNAWRKSLRVGGRVLGGLFAEGSLPELGEIASRHSPVAWRAPNAWRAALAGAGLRLLREGTEERVFVFRSAREFFRSLHGVGAAPRRQLDPGALRRLLQIYETRFGAREGVRATWTFYRFEAERMERSS